MERLRLKNWSECIARNDFESRLAYLRLHGKVDSPRSISHPFYSSRVWRDFKEDMHIRDAGFDLAVFGVEIVGRRYLHHINPVTWEDLENFNENILLNPENVITASGNTHNIIHYRKKIEIPYVEREAGDMILW